MKNSTIFVVIALVSSICSATENKKTDIAAVGQALLANAEKCSAGFNVQTCSYCLTKEHLDNPSCFCGIIQGAIDADPNLTVAQYYAILQFKNADGENAGQIARRLFNTTNCQFCLTQARAFNRELAKSERFMEKNPGDITMQAIQSGLCKKIN